MYGVVFLVFTIKFHSQYVMEKVMKVDLIFDVFSISNAVTVAGNLVNYSVLFLANG